MDHFYLGQAFIFGGAAVMIFHRYLARNATELIPENVHRAGFFVFGLLAVFLGIGILFRAI